MDSPYALITQLCEAHIKNFYDDDKFHGSIYHPVFYKKNLLKKLKTIAYNHLLTHCKYSDSNDFKTENILAIRIYNLRNDHQYDEAARLEKLSNIVHNSPGFLSDHHSMLKLLLLLAKDKKMETTVIGHEVLTHPLIIDQKDTFRFRLPGPPLYGDSQLWNPDDLMYMQYNRNLFEKPSFLSNSEQNFDPNIFEIIPGTNLNGEDLITSKIKSANFTELKSETPFFGAFVRKHNLDLNMKLEIPELPEDLNSRHLDMQLTFKSQCSEDEGFTEADIPTITPNTSDSQDAEDLWEKAQKCSQITFYSWETIGCAVKPIEKPFLTEAGPQVVDEIIKTKLYEALLMDSTIKLPIRFLVDQKLLVKQVINLLIGVPSETFLFNEVQQAFYLQDGVYVSGISSETLTNMLSDLIESGTSFIRLCKFSVRPVFNSRYTAGLVFQAFVGGVRQFLQYYRACILSFDQEQTLLRINITMREILSQLRYLSKLCFCSQNIQNKDQSQISFPTGVKLLSYLYQEALDASHASYYPLLLFLFHCSCSPYIIFLRNWILEGICRDVYEEFMITVHEDYLLNQDKFYWTEAFVMTSTNITECVPKFLTELAKDIYICGKSVNLLKLCCPEHHMCNINSKAFPFFLSFSELEMNHISQQSKTYVSRMLQISRQRMLTREQILQKQERDKQLLMTQARETAVKELQRLQNNLFEKKKAEDAKKRQHFQELKEQMQQDKERRLLEKQKQAEKDARYALDETKTDYSQTTLVPQVHNYNDELLMYYSRVNVEIAHHEQRLLWNVKRQKNDFARKVFLNTEEENLQEALLTLNCKKDEEVFKQSFFDSSQEEILGLNSEGDPSVTDFLSDISNLPNWAQKTLIGSATVTIEEVPPELVKKFKAAREKHEGFEEMPKWAQIRLLSVESKVNNDCLASEYDNRNILLLDSNSSLLEIPEKPLEDHKIARTDKKICKISTLCEEQKLKPPMFKRERTFVIDKPNVDLNVVEISQTIELQSMPDPNEIADIGTNEKFQKINKIHSLEQHFEETADISKNVEDELQTTIDVLEAKPDEIEENMIVHHISQEMEENAYKSLIKMNVRQHILLESEEEPQKSSIKLVLNKHSSNESNKESNSRHIKMTTKHHPSDESFMKYPDDIFEPKPSIRIFVDKHCNKHSELKHTFRPSIKLFPKQHSSQESDQGLDLHFNYESRESETFVSKKQKKENDNLKEVLIKDLNIEENSVCQDQIMILNASSEDNESVEEFNEKFKSSIDSVDITELYDEEKNVWLNENYVEPYQKNFNIVDQPLQADLMNSLPDILSQELETSDMYSQFHSISAYKLYPLPVIIERSIITPLLAQTYLVNQSIVNYFMVELEICHHFEALRRFLFLEDGEFGQSLSDQLFEKLATCLLPAEILNPVVLNSILAKALKSSLYGDSKESDNLGFIVKYLPRVFLKKSITSLNCLELSYKVEWPNNIVITENSLIKYNMIFSFMLQVRQPMWALSDVWHNLKRTAVINNAANSPQLRQLQLFRHEMQHFVKIMQGYIANQIIQVSWEEFQQELNTNVHNLDELHDRHTDYLNKTIFRCLLNKKAGPIMKIIQDIFSLILKFRLQLISLSWQVNPYTFDVVHPNFKNMESTFIVFKDYAMFLYKVVSKLSIRGYQPHLQDFLLRLNFNSYYNEQ